MVRVWVLRAYALRHDNWRKTLIVHPFQIPPKTIFDAGKTMSYVEKIMSDIIQITSDLFSAIANVSKAETYAVAIK